MACDVIRKSKKKYCDADLRHIIDINLRSTSSDINNNASSYIKESITGVYANIESKPSQVQYIDGNAITGERTHCILMKYYQEFDTFINNAVSYTIKCGAKSFKILFAEVIDLDSLWIKVDVSLVNRS